MPFSFLLAAFCSFLYTSSPHALPNVLLGLLSARRQNTIHFHFITGNSEDFSDFCDIKQKSPPPGMESYWFSTLHELCVSMCMCVYSLMICLTRTSITMFNSIVESGKLCVSNLGNRFQSFTTECHVVLEFLHKCLYQAKDNFLSLPCIF